MLRKFTLVISLLLAACNGEFPSDLTKCKAQDFPCIIDRANYIVRKYARTGYPALAIPVLDPYQVGNIVVNQGGSSPINLNMQFKSATIKGLDGQNYERVAGFSKDPSKGRFEFYGTMPNVEVTGEYKSDGRVLLLPVTGEGDFKLTLTNVKAGLKVKATTVEKDGLHYYKVNKIKVLLEPETLDIELTNLFNGNKELSDSFLAVVKQNWRSAWDEISPPLFDITEKAVKNVMQDLFDKIPHEDFYLPD